MVKTVNELLHPKAPNEQQKLDAQSDDLIDGILSLSPLTKVRRSDAYKEYLQYKADTGDELTFQEFLKQTL